MGALKRAVAAPAPNRANGEARHAKRRSDMVESQLAARGIRDPRVLEAMRALPRELFVQEALAERAYDDRPLPIGHGQTISQPYIVALMLEALQLVGTEKVLEIGAGSGYMTLLLASLADQVFSIERLGALTAQLQFRINERKVYNVHVRTADGTRGWIREAPFDGIVVSAAASSVPFPLKEQLAEGGRLVMPVGGEGRQRLVRVRRTPEGFTEEILCECQFVRLIGEHGWTG